MSPGAAAPAAARRAATPYRLMLAHLARGAYASPVQAEGEAPGLLAQGFPAAEARKGTPRSPATPAWAGAGGAPAFPYTVTPAGTHPGGAI